MKELVNELLDCLRNPNNEALQMSLNNVHAPGLFSLVLKGSEPGKLTRVFFADNKLRPFDVQLHTHRYPIKLTVVKGKVVQHEAVKSVHGVSIPCFEYRSFLNGGFGLTHKGSTKMIVSDFIIPPGASLPMSEIEYHTISASKGSIWIVEEMGFARETSFVLGLPFTIDGLYSKPEMFQINDKCQLLMGELTAIKKNFDAH